MNSRNSNKMRDCQGTKFTIISSNGVYLSANEKENPKPLKNQNLMRNTSSFSRIFTLTIAIGTFATKH